MTVGWLPEEMWERVVIGKWTLRLLRLVFPRRWWVQIRGRVYILRDPQ